MGSLRDVSLNRRKMSQEYILVCRPFGKIPYSLLLQFHLQRVATTLFPINRSFSCVIKYKTNQLKCLFCINSSFFKEISIYQDSTVVIMYGLGNFQWPTNRHAYCALLHIRGGHLPNQLAQIKLLQQKSAIIIC